MFVSRSDADSHATASFYSFVCGCAGGHETRQEASQQQQNQTYRDREEEGVEKSEKEKAYYQKTDGPQFTVAPRGPGGTTLCTSGLPAQQRRGGALKHNSACVHFCLLTCKQKANL